MVMKYFLDYWKHGHRFIVCYDSWAKAKNRADKLKPEKYTIRRAELLV